MPEPLIDTKQLGKELETALARGGSRVEVHAKAMVVVTHHLAKRVEKRLAELERCPFQYDGPHETGKEYRKGTFVTRAGSLWHCNSTTDATPGDGPDWTLAVKRGKDSY